MSKDPQYFGANGKPTSADALCRDEPEWAAGLLRESGRQLSAALAKVTELEKARSTLHDDYWARVQRCEELAQENARLRREVEDVRALDEWQAPGSGRNLELASGADHQACYLHGWDGEVIHKATGATLSAARRAAVEYLKKGGKDG